MNIIGEQLVSLRDKLGISQKELADMIEITPTRLNYWEKGKRQPDIEMIIKLSSALNTSPNFLLGWDDIEKQIRKFDCFGSYLKSIDYILKIEVDQILKTHTEDMIDDKGTIVGHSEVIDDATYLYILKKEGKETIFNQKEFEEFQEEIKKSVDYHLYIKNKQ